MCLLAVQSNQRAGRTEETKRLDHQWFGERKRTSATILRKAHSLEGGVFLHYKANTVWQEIDIQGWYQQVNINFRPIFMSKNTNWRWLVAGRFPAQRANIPEYDGVFVISLTKLLNRQSRAGEIWRLDPHVTSTWWCSLLCCVLFCCGMWFCYQISMVSWDEVTHILQGCITGNGAITWLPQCHWSNPEGYGWNHNKTSQSTNWWLCIRLW